MAKVAFLKSSDAPLPGPVAPGEPGTADDTPQLEGYADSRRASRVGLWALAIGFGGFLLWATFAPLDEGVVAPGQVSIETHRKPVQHLSGGLVKEVLVREGEVVKAGQVLVRLDEATTKANFEGSRQKYMTLRAMEGRLIAEQTGAAKINFHPELVEAAAKDPAIRSVMSTQEQLLAARRGNLAADLASLRQQVQGQEESIRAYRAIVESRRSQLALLTEELRNFRELVTEGYAPRSRQWELERSVAETNAGISDALGNIQRGLANIGDLRSRFTAREQEFRKDGEQQMADVRAQVQAESERLRALTGDLSRIEIKAPASGQVVGMQMQTPGGVVQPGQKLMDIVPYDEPLLLEAKVPPNFIDRVHAGLPVDIRFNTFAHTPTLVVGGKVISISSDLVTDPNNANLSFYLARVEVTPEGKKKLGARQLQAGMPTEMVFRTGERSLLNYLLGPVYKRMATSMKES